MNDVVRWLVQSISTEDRRETEQELLQLYHQRLVEHGVRGYGYKKFLADYRTNLIVVYLMFSMSMDAIDQSSERARALFHQFYARLDAALVDWDVEKQLKALPWVYRSSRSGSPCGAGSRGAAEGPPGAGQARTAGLPSAQSTLSVRWSMRQPSGPRESRST